MSKKLLALALTLALVVSLCPTTLAASTLKASEATTEVEKKLANLQTQSGFRPGDSNSNCFTFAMSVTDKIFGVKLSDIQYHGEAARTGSDKQGYLVRIGRCFKSHSGYTCKYSSSGAAELNAANVKQLLSQAKCGDVIQTTRKTSDGHKDSYANSNCETRHPHTMIVQSVGENSLVVYEGNMNGQKVNIRSVTYADFASTYNHTITLFRAENYDKVNGSSSNSTPATTAPSTLTISPTTEPGENMPQGQPFYFKGKITSNYPITSASISINTPDLSKSYQGKTIAPNTTTVDIATSGLDALKFGQLSPGSYLFYLTVTDQSGKNVIWQKRFSIAGSAIPTTPPSTSTPAPAASTLAISPINKPGQNMKLGETFDFTAKITSNYNITSAQLDIREEGKTGVKQAHALLIDPNQKEVNYSTKGLSGIQFERLLAGSYRLCLTVKDSSGATKQWEQAFTIVDSTPKTYTIRIHTVVDGADSGTATLSVKEGESRSHQLFRTDVPTLVTMEAGSWDKNRTLTFADVRRNIEVYAYYKTTNEDETPPASESKEETSATTAPEKSASYTVTFNYLDENNVVLNTEFEEVTEGSAVTHSLKRYADYEVVDCYSRYYEKFGFNQDLYTVYIPAVYKSGSITLVHRPIPNRGLDAFHKVNTYYSGTFYDVSSSDWFDENVERAYELGLMKGMSDNAFDPNSSVTVAQAITLAARLHSIYYTGEEHFVQSGQNWYDVYVTYARDNGILQGAYNYDYPISRGDFAHILAKAFPSEALPVIDSDIYFDDVKSSTPYKSDIYLLAQAGIIRGAFNAFGTLDFSPSNGITRAEVAAIVTRMADPSLR